MSELIAGPTLGAGQARDVWLEWHRQPAPRSTIRLLRIRISCAFPPWTFFGEWALYFSDTTRNFYHRISSYGGVLLSFAPESYSIQGRNYRTVSRLTERSRSSRCPGQPDAKLNDLNKAHLYPDSPERAYLKSAEADFDHADAASAADLMSTLRVSSGVEVTASRNVVAHVATIGARRYIFLANFDGLKAGEVATPRTQRDIEDQGSIGILGSQLHILPFLGTESVVSSKPEGSGVEFTASCELSAAPSRGSIELGQGPLTKAGCNACTAKKYESSTEP